MRIADIMSVNKAASVTIVMKCDECEGAEINTGLNMEVYDTPFDKESWTAKFCSSECQNSFCSEGEAPYLECEDCNTWICYRNPMNGYQIQFRYDDASGNICLSCNKDDILKNGQPSREFSGSIIDGGSFISTSDLQTAGYSPVPGFVNKHICCARDAQEYNDRAQKLIGFGSQVVTSFRSMGVPAIEGYISMYFRYNSDNVGNGGAKRTRDEGDEEYEGPVLIPAKKARAQDPRKVLQEDACGKHGGASQCAQDPAE